MNENEQDSELINFHDPRIQRQIRQLCADCKSPADQVAVLARFVREQIELEVEARPIGVKASEVLCFRRGSAVGKAVLLAALCRGAGLPCRIRFHQLSGAPAQWVSLSRLSRLEWADAHPYNEVQIGDKWLPIDVSLDSRNAARLGVKMPSLDGTTDATLGRAVPWDTSSGLSVGEETVPPEELMVELLRLTATSFRG